MQLTKPVPGIKSVNRNDGVQIILVMDTDKISA
jgi:hypothetical protein